MPNNNKISPKQGGTNPNTSSLPSGYDYKRLESTEATHHFNKKSLLTSTNHYEVLAYEHAIAFTVANLMEQDLLQDTYQLMQQAIKDGLPFNEFKKQLMPQLAKKGWLAKGFAGSDGTLDKSAQKDYKQYLGRRLKTIYHTNKQTAYAAGRWRRIQNSKERMPYLQYMPSLSTHQRDDHKQYYGLVRPIDDPIWTKIYPPNGFGCKCWVKQLSTKQAEQVGISEPITLETDTVKNPHTGEMITTTKGVHFSFNHNFDRLTALIRLGEEKHGEAFAKALADQLPSYMVDYASEQGVQVEHMSHLLTRTQNALNLAKDPSGNNRLSEGVLADKWEQYYGVKLERYNNNKHKVLAVNDPPDYVVIQADVNPTQWTTLDFMFSLEPNANKIEFNKSFYRSDKAWKKRQARILQHLQKADIIPMYLKHMDNQTLVKIIGFVLSLPKDLQNKIVLIQ